MNNIVHCKIVHSIRASSASVLLFAFRFCFLETETTEPMDRPPNRRVAPVWLLKSGWTAEDGFTIHLVTVISLAVIVSTYHHVEWRYFIIIRISLAQSDSVGSFAGVLNMAIWHLKLAFHHCQVSCLQPVWPFSRPL